MNLVIANDTKSIIMALKSYPRNDKIKIIENLESDLLSEWDDYEETVEVNSRVQEALEAYESGDFVELKDLL